MAGTSHPSPLEEKVLASCSWDGGGTHTGPAFADHALGELKTHNAGKKIRFTGTTVFRMKGGKIVEEMGEEGALRACSQLGLLGTSGGRKPQS